MVIQFIIQVELFFNHIQDMVNKKNEASPEVKLFNII